MDCDNPFSFCKMKKSLLKGVEIGNLFPGALRSFFFFFHCSGFCHTLT